MVNNARFLILPWVRSLGLASKILSKAARQLHKDWLARYGFAPVLLETFVEFERHKGTCYKAANWTLVGRTAGRGKKSKSNKPLIPIKDIWLYPLRRDWQTILRRPLMGVERIVTQNEPRNFSYKKSNEPILTWNCRRHQIHQGCR